MTYLKLTPPHDPRVHGAHMAEPLVRAAAEFTAAHIEQLRKSGWKVEECGENGNLSTPTAAKPIDRKKG